MNKCVLLFFAFVCAAPAFAQTYSCPSGMEDMMAFFTMGYPDRQTDFMGPGNANPIYTTIVPDDGDDFATSGYFVWTKSSVGYPWDVKTFDENYIYDRTTEKTWTDPTSFKRFTTDLPLSQRCITFGEAGAAIKVASANTNYSSYENCSITQTQNLGYVLNQMSAPATVSTGGNLGDVKTRTLTYQYSCDSSYGNCKYKEVFSLGFQIGLYNWQYYENENGKWTLQQQSKINNYTGGSVVPYLPCSKSY